MFPQNFLDELIARNDIADVVSSYVTLQQKGGNLFGLCPFHNEKTPSFSVSPSKQIYHCFGCKKGGGVINFIMEVENLSFPDAVQFLAKRANMEVPEEQENHGASQLRKRLLDLNRDAARWYYEVLQSPQGAAVQAYLDKRQIRKGIAVRFGMNGNYIRPGFCKVGYIFIRFADHQMHVEQNIGTFSERFNNRRSECYIRHKMTVHHIQMQHIGSRRGTFGALHAEG